MWRSPKRAPTASTTSLSRKIWLREALAGLDAHHPRPQRVVLGDRALAHVASARPGSRGPRPAPTSSSEALARITPPPARISGRSAPASMLERGGDGGRVRLGRDVRPAASVGLGVILDVRALLHVEREVDQHRARPALARDAERLAEGPRQLRGLLDLVGPLADGPGDVDDVDGLERLLVQHVAVRLPGDADHRDRVGQRGVEPGDHVRAGGPGRADADARLAGDPRPAVGGVRAALLVADVRWRMLEWRIAS